MSTDSPPERYHRRHRWPILVFLLVVLVGAGIIWFQILKPGPAAATGCNQPGPAPSTASATSRSTASGGASGVASSSAGPKKSAATTTGKSTARSTPTSPTASTTGTTSVTTRLGAFVAAASLAGVRPADPSTVTLQVVNASTIRGQAKTVTKDLQAAGFASILPADNDGLYPAFDLACTAEIRFGQAGQAQARTVLIIAPCAQLIVDDRIDESVDLSLGARYEYTPVTDAMKQQLKAIHDDSAPPAVIEGQTAAPKPPAPIPALPTADCSGSPTTSSR